jgi:CRP/FNR family transcriptional regulator, cyclic AMP receptor protein
MDVRDRIVLQSDPWFTALSAERQERLTTRLRIKTFERSTRIYGIGDPPDGLWVVLGGEVRLTSYSATGAEVVGLILRPGRWFGELSVLDGGPRPHDAIALCRSRLAIAPASAIEALAREDPGLWRSIAVLTCRHHRRALARIERNVFQTSKARLAALLSARVDKNHPDDPVRINQADLANTVGVSRQRVNRLLGELRAEGVIRTDYGRVAILNRARLASEAGG